VIAMRAERGVAMVLAILAMLVIMAIGGALVLTTGAETLIASTFRAGHQAFYAAESAAEWSVADLAANADWPGLLASSATSTFVDGPASGTRALDDGSVVDLGRLEAEEPPWRLYGYGPLSALVPASGRPPPHYVVLLIAPDPAGPDRIRVRAVSFGRRGARRMVEQLLLRGPAGVTLEKWQEVR
jgi:hypothetical protein